MDSNDRAPHGRGMAWATLLVAGGISLGVNLWHAFDRAPGGHVTWWFGSLAMLYGTAPVVLAAFQSHSAAFAPMGRVKRTLTYLLVLLGMVLSVQAQAAAVAVFAGDWLKWVFPVLVDLSAFMALHTLMSSGSADSSMAPSTGVPEAEPVREPAVDAEPVPVYASEPAPVPAAPLERSTPDVPAAPVPAVPVQTGGPEQSVPPAVPVGEPAVQTAPDRTAAPVPDRSEPSVQTEDVPVLTSKKDGDEDALEQLRTAFAGTDPAEVTIGMVRRELGGAGFARGKRLHGLWQARTAAADRSAAEPSADAVDRDEDGADGERETDRTADRVTVPA